MMKIYRKTAVINLKLCSTPPFPLVVKDVVKRLWTAGQSGTPGGTVESQALGADRPGPRPWPTADWMCGVGQVT